MPSFLQLPWTPLISYNGTPNSNMECYSSYVLFLYHDGTPYWWDVMTYCLSWWNSLRGCHDHEPGCSFSQLMVEILCGDVRLLQFLCWGHRFQWTIQITRKTKYESTTNQIQYRDITETFVIMWYFFVYSFQGLMWHLWCFFFQKDNLFSFMNSLKWNDIFKF